jgi:hypothetical protein
MKRTVRYRCNGAGRRDVKVYTAYIYIRYINFERKAPFISVVLRVADTVGIPDTRQRPVYLQHGLYSFIHSQRPVYRLPTRKRTHSEPSLPTTVFRTVAYTRANTTKYARRDGRIRASNTSLEGVGPSTSPHYILRHCAATRSSQVSTLTG